MTDTNEAPLPDPPPTEQPLLQVTLYETEVLLTRYTTAPTGSSTYPVELDALVAAVANLDMAFRTGLLPPQILFYNRHHRQEHPTIGLFVPPRRQTVLVQAGLTTQTLILPTPPLIFVGQGKQYGVFATKQKNRTRLTTTTPLYHAPFPNVYGIQGQRLTGLGIICTGNTPMPTCTVATIEQAFRLFIAESAFNQHLAGGKSKSHPRNVLDLWQVIAGGQRFPTRELVPTPYRLGQLLDSI